MIIIVIYRTSLPFLTFPDRLQRREACNWLHFDQWQGDKRQLGRILFELPRERLNSLFLVQVHWPVWHRTGSQYPECSYSMYVLC